MPAKRLHGEAHRRRPAARRPLHLGGRVGIVAAGEGAQEVGGLLGVECEIRPRDLEHLTLPAEPLDREGEIGAGREHEVEPCGRLPAQSLDELHRARRRGHLVHVVQHEDEVTSQLGLQRLADHRREPACARELVLLGTGACGGGDGPGHVGGQAGNA